MKNTIYGIFILIGIFIFFIAPQNCSKRQQHIQVEKSAVSIKTENLKSDLKNINPIDTALLNKKDVCISSLHCVKYVNYENSEVKIIEIIVQGKESVQIKTYNKNGLLVDLEPEYQLELKGTRVPARIDVNLIKVIK